MARRLERSKYPPQAVRDGDGASEPGRDPARDREGRALRASPGTEHGAAPNPGLDALSRARLAVMPCWPERESER
jgi:hypothetical protein